MSGLEAAWAAKPAKPSTVTGTASQKLAAPEAVVMDAAAQAAGLFAFLDALGASP